MGMTEMMSAVNAGSLTASTSTNDGSGSVNLTHFINLITKVYCKAFDLFEDVKLEDVTKKAIEIANNDVEIVSMFAKNIRTEEGKSGKAISDCDVVSVIEALRWTGIFRATQEKMKFNLAVVQPTELMDKPMDKPLTGTMPYNAFLLTDYEGTDYTHYGEMFKATVTSLPILARSKDEYEVLINRNKEDK